MNYSVSVVMLIVWTPMALFVLWVGVGIRVRPEMVPMMVTFVLGGALFERFRPSTVS